MSKWHSFWFLSTKNIQWRGIRGDFVISWPRRVPGLLQNRIMAPSRGPLEDGWLPQIRRFSDQDLPVKSMVESWGAGHLTYFTERRSMKIRIKHAIFDLFLAQKVLPKEAMKAKLRQMQVPLLHRKNWGPTVTELACHVWFVIETSETQETPASSERNSMGLPGQPLLDTLVL